MLRAVAFVAVSALFFTPLTAPASHAAEQDAKKKEAPAKKPEMKTRGFHKEAPEPVSPGAAPPPPRPDSGKAEDTIGGFPGRWSGPANSKQP